MVIKMTSGDVFRIDLVGQESITLSTNCILLNIHINGVNTDTQSAHTFKLEVILSNNSRSYDINKEVISANHSVITNKNVKIKLSPGDQLTVVNDTSDSFGKYLLTLIEL